MNNVSREAVPSVLSVPWKVGGSGLNGRQYLLNIEQSLCCMCYAGGLYDRPSPEHGSFRDLKIASK